MKQMKSTAAGMLSPMLLAALLLLCAWGEAEAGRPAAAATIECPPTVPSGLPFLCTLRLDQAAEGVSLTWSGRTMTPVLTPHPEGGLTAEVLLGAGLGMAGTEQTVQVRLSRGAAEKSITRPVAITEREYPVQRLTLPGHMVNPPQEVHPRIREESEQVRSVLDIVTTVSSWSLPLYRPVPGDVISPFGVRRILNDQPRSTHRGVDFRGAEGILVKAAAAGVVVLVEDHYFAGTSVYIDHGSGVISMYFHLAEALTVEGQVVGAGEAVGRIGRTGRVTGPHLHFGISILGELVDPMPLFSAPALDQG
jgi:hypothetical protein